MLGAHNVLAVRVTTYGELDDAMAAAAADTGPDGAHRGGRAAAGHSATSQ